MSTDIVLAERQGDVVLITLNRPEARNAMNHELAQATVDAITDAQDAGAIVITGAGKAFCAGLDLRDLGVDRLAQLPPFNATAAASRVPIVAAVNGPAVTGGFELALACDFMVGCERAAFADTHLRVGVYPGPVLVDLPRRVGMARAREMSLTGNFVDADTALRIGLINHLVPHEELVPFALGLAQAIAEQDRGMVAAMRDDWNETGGLLLADAHRTHIANGEKGGYRSSTNEQLASNREAVLARSRNQRAGFAAGPPASGA
jgi:enoyl-CoA hydratase